STAKTNREKECSRFASERTSQRDHSCMVWKFFCVGKVSPRSGLVQPCAAANPAGASRWQSLRLVRRVAELGSLGRYAKANQRGPGCGCCAVSGASTLDDDRPGRVSTGVSRRSEVHLLSLSNTCLAP